MKRLSKFLIIFLLFIISCQYSVDNNSNNIRHNNEFAFFEDSVCYLKFKDSINGFDVKIKLNYFSSFDDVIRGNAEIAFFKDGKLRMYFNNPSFSLRQKGLDNLKNGEIVELDYNMPSINTISPFKLEKFKGLPFFFLDVDFDGKEELVLNYAGKGQRNINAFVAFGLDYNYETPTYDYLYDPLRDVAPYSDLDELTEIDYTKSEISTFGYSGYSDNEKRIYKRFNDEIRLDRIEDYDSMGYVLSRRRVLKIDTITTYHNNRKYLYK